MKKSLYTILFALVTMFAVSACTEESIQPQDGGSSSGDKCQFGCQ